MSLEMQLKLAYGYLRYKFFNRSQEGRYRSQPEHCCFIVPVKWQLSKISCQRHKCPDVQVSRHPSFWYELAQNVSKCIFSNADFQKFLGSLFYIPFYVVCQFQVPEPNMH